MNKGIKGYFITGLLVVVPLYISVYVLSLIVGFMDNAFNILPKALRPDTYLPVHIPGQGILFTLIGIFVVGVLTANILGQRLMDLTDNLISRVPILKSVYTATKQLMETFFAKGQGGFRKVVLVEFPRQGIYSIGFVTGKTRGEVKDVTPEGTISIFLPTTPNPTSGFYIVARESEVLPLKMKVEEAFKVLMSGGMIMPGDSELRALARKSGQKKSGPETTGPDKGPEPGA